VYIVHCDTRGVLVLVHEHASCLVVSDFCGSSSHVLPLVAHLDTVAVAAKHRYLHVELDDGSVLLDVASNDALAITTRQ
jgi:hypothetical protein